MGRRGPPPKPTALRLVDGNAGHRPLNAREPVPPRGAPSAPDFLTDRARAVWDQLVPRLATVGIVRSIDGLAIGRYCQYIVEWKDLAAFLEKNGDSYPVRADPVVGKDGKEKPGRVLYFREFPKAARQLKLEAKLIAIEREFGLTPAARTRIRIEEEKGMKKDVNEANQRFFSA